MPIPYYERVVYEYPGLAEVVCQLQFPSILSITKEEPAELQEEIRQEFPYFNERNPQLDGMPEEVRKIVPQAALSNPSDRIFDFESENKKWKFSLTKNFIALSTSEYSKWEEFKERLKNPLEALIKIYNPAFYERVGLRYQNVIVRSTLGLQNRPWSALLQPHIAGEFGDTRVEDDIEMANRQLTLKLPEDDSQVTVKHGLGIIEKTKESCYVIDSDYSKSGRTEQNNAIYTLDALNKYAGRLFRWCITDELHQALGPSTPS